MKLGFGLVIVAATLHVRAAEASCMCAGNVLTSSVAEGSPAIVYEASCPPDRAPAFTFEDATGKQIAGKVSATHLGHKTVQYVVHPTTRLQPGSYTFVVGKKSQYTQHAITVMVTGKPTPLTWKRDPKVVAQRQIELGCGPVKSVEVDLGDATAELAFIQLSDESSKQKAAGYVRIESSRISIGHDMCGGPFPLEDDHDYSAAVSIIAPDGTLSAWKPVSFTYAPRHSPGIRVITNSGPIY